MNIPAKTNLDLYVSATNAAQAAVGLTTSFDLESAKLAAFKGEDQNPLDYAFWETTFDERRTHFSMLGKQQTASAIAALKAAQTAAAPKPAAS